MSDSYQPNSAGFRAMAIGPEIRAAVKAEAERAKGVAEGLAEDFRVTGNYADSFEVSDSTTELRTGFGSHPVATGVLTNISEHAAAVEWGNEHMRRPHRVLARTLAGLGG